LYTDHLKVYKKQFIKPIFGTSVRKIINIPLLFRTMMNHPLLNVLPNRLVLKGNQAFLSPKHYRIVSF